MQFIDQLKKQPFFADELKEVAAKVKAGVTPAFTVNKYMAMLQSDPSISFVLDYIVTRDLKEVMTGVALPGDVVKVLHSQEAKAWWTLFKNLLIQTMNALAQEAMGNTAAGGGEAAPGGQGAAGAAGP